MPVVLTARDEIDVWMNAPAEEALKLQRPFPDDPLKIIARGIKKDEGGLAAARQSRATRKPVAVGGSRERGVVAAGSYEAREFGVHSAMPSATAKQMFQPDLRKAALRCLQDGVAPDPRDLRRYTPTIEPRSLDEAYLDVTENLKGIVSATQIAETIRAKIRTGTGLNSLRGSLPTTNSSPNSPRIVTPMASSSLREMGPAFSKDCRSRGSTSSIPTAYVSSMRGINGAVRPVSG
jgi:hypothetical protein